MQSNLKKTVSPAQSSLKTQRLRRLKDGVNYDDAEVVGFNPCVEQSLHNAEMCCLVETFPAKHDDYEDYVKTLKCLFVARPSHL